MRFQHKPKPQKYDFRHRQYFAFWPITIGRETRWLERVVVVEQFYKSSYPPFERYWYPVRFEDAN